MQDLASNIPIIAGSVAAFLHVIAGPDHLAAVTPLAIEEKGKSWKIGISWGLGHVFGMILIGFLFTALKEIINFPIEKFSEYSEAIVGFVLIAIGIWAFYIAFSKRKKHIHPHTHKKDNKQFTHIHKHEHTEDAEHQHEHKAKQKSGFYAAMGIGTLHGFAGLSHFILFLPTLAFENTANSIFYIFGFVIGTLAAMTLYAFILGIIAKKTSEINRSKLFAALRYIGGSFAIIIGIYWVYLSFSV